MNNKVTIKDVAKKSGYSIATVSYVINNINKVTEETKQKVLAAIEELGYEPDITARSLVKKESRFIGILVPTEESDKRTIFTENPFYQEFFSGVEYKAQELGYSIVIVGTKEEKECLKIIKGNSLAGVIVLGLINNKVYSGLQELGIPVVIIDQERKFEEFCYISTEDEIGAFKAVEHLIEKGHRNIALLNGNFSRSIVHINRFNGYKKALEKNKIELNEENIILENITFEGGIKAAEKIYNMLSKITAVFAISDIMALGLIKGLYMKGVIVPRDLSIVGFDDIRSSKIFIPGLTTVRQDVFNKGEKSVEIIIHNLRNPQKPIKDYIEKVTLIKRESVK